MKTVKFMICQIQTAKFTIRTFIVSWCQLGKLIKAETTHQPQWVPGLQTRLSARVSHRRSRWRMYWRNRLLHQVFYHLASGHQVEFHAPNSTTPSMHCPFEHPLGPHGLIYTRAINQNFLFLHFVFVINLRLVEEPLSRIASN